ncbi:hypothetical protein VP01_61g15 [Puccinia sorghi]|uniref:Uncharacterized protein n=1 Tax=Puccinia sorghi TaxID=27349 RepID=A0A0L6UHI6_9BASI|nr:hypothetical protein VP01_61g15 [Puccinia sorghi]
MKRRNSSSGEPRAAKRRRSKSKSVAIHEEPKESCPSPAPIPVNQDESQTPTENREEEGQADETPLVDEDQVDKRIVQAIKRYEKDDFAERDLWDTVLQLAYQRSQNLSQSLVHWGRRGGIREQRSIKPAAGQDPRLPQGAFENLGADTDYSEPRIYDPTANSFTLWPLSVQSCPTPQWTLDEELSSLVIRTERKYATVDYNDHCSIDHERENEKTDSLANQTRQTLMQLLNNLYECHPPHSSCIPIFTRGKLYKRLCKSTNPESTTDQSTDPRNEKEVDYGLDWNFVLGVASSTLNLKESVIQRTRERLAEMYRVPLELDNGDKGTGPTQPSQVATCGVNRYRELEPLSKSED